MSLFLETRRATYAAQRQASHGAGITLVAGCGEYAASFNCAKRVASILGERQLAESDTVPVYSIPFSEMHVACQKLAERYSVALVDFAMEKHGSRFVLIWRINGKADLVKPEFDLNEF